MWAAAWQHSGAWVRHFAYCLVTDKVKICWLCHWVLNSLSKAGFFQGWFLLMVVSCFRMLRAIPYCTVLLGVYPKPWDSFSPDVPPLFCSCQLWGSRSFTQPGQQDCATSGFTGGLKVLPELLCYSTDVQLMWLGRCGEPPTSLQRYSTAVITNDFQIRVREKTEKGWSKGKHLKWLKV